MNRSKRPDKSPQARPDSRRKTPKSEEDLQPKDAGEMPREPQNPVDPSPEPTS